MSDGGGEAPLPVLEFYAHVDLPGGVDLEALAQWANLALPLCLKSPGPHESNLVGLKEVEISLISDATIGEVHAEFMDDPSPTDVITFQHGEILVSTETAVNCAVEHGNSAARETLLYVIHGLLHLNGHEDADLKERDRMHEVQESILNSVLPNS